MRSSPNYVKNFLIDLKLIISIIDWIFTMLEIYFFPLSCRKSAHFRKITSLESDSLEENLESARKSF